MGRFAVAVGVLAVLTSACRGGGARAAANLPMPQDAAQWIAIVVVVVGLYWLFMKIIRG